MFTGIITAMGEVVEAAGERLGIAARPIAEGLEIGGSVAVSGACLTAVAVDREGGRFEVELSPETQTRTTLGGLKGGDRVNLELPLRWGDRLGGHLVQGHVDAVGEVIASEPQERFRLLTFRVDPRHHPLLVEKGAVAIDGVSLTPFNIGDEGHFQVAVIPHTLRETTLQGLAPGDKVNVEFDLVGKYVEKQARARCWS